MNQNPPVPPPQQPRRRAPVGRTQVLADMTPPDDSSKKAFLMSCGVLIVLLFLMSIGCLMFNVIGGFISKPLIAGVGAICAVLLGVPYLLIILWLDRNEKEPPWLLATAFLWGAVISTMVSCVFNTSFGCVAQGVFGPLGGLLTASFSAPFIEEITKGLALVAIFLFFKKEFDNVLDGIVYGAVVGLGFAVFENWLYYVQICNSVEDVFYLAFIRGVVAGVGSHACYTALFGIGIGLFRVMRSGGTRWLMPPLFLALAMFVHFSWNTFAGFFFPSGIDDIKASTLKGRLVQTGWELQGQVKRYNAKKISKGHYYKASVRADKALAGDPQLKGTVRVFQMKSDKGADKVVKKYPEAAIERDGRVVVVADLPDSDAGEQQLLRAALSPTLAEIAKGPIFLPALFIHIPFVLLVLVVSIVSLRHETRLIRTYLATEKAPVLHQGELDRLVPASRRGWHVMSLLLRFRFGDWWRRRQRNTLLIRLAFERWHMDSEDKADRKMDGHFHAKRVLELRTELSNLEPPE